MARCAAESPCKQSFFTTTRCFEPFKRARKTWACSTPSRHWLRFTHPPWVCLASLSVLEGLVGMWSTAYWWSMHLALHAGTQQLPHLHVIRRYRAQHEHRRPTCGAAHTCQTPLPTRHTPSGTGSMHGYHTHHAYRGLCRVGNCTLNGGRMKTEVAEGNIRGEQGTVYTMRGPSAQCD